MNWVFLVKGLVLFFELNFSYQQHYLFFVVELRFIFLKQGILWIIADSIFREFIMRLTLILFQASKFSNS
jgi:hypothetical protein